MSAEDLFHGSPLEDDHGAGRRSHSDRLGAGRDRTADRASAVELYVVATEQDRIEQNRCAHDQSRRRLITPSPAHRHAPWAAGNSERRLMTSVGEDAVRLRFLLQVAILLLVRPPIPPAILIVAVAGVLLIGDLQQGV